MQSRQEVPRWPDKIFILSDASTVTLALWAVSGFFKAARGCSWLDRGMSVDSRKESQVPRVLDMSWLANMSGQAHDTVLRSYQICKRARPYAQHETALPPTPLLAALALPLIYTWKDPSLLFLEVCKGNLGSVKASADSETVRLLKLLASKQTRRILTIL